MGSVITRLVIVLVLAALADPPLTVWAQDGSPNTLEAPASPVNPLVVSPTPTPVAFPAPPNPAECTIAPRPVEDFVAVPDATPRTGPVTTPTRLEDLPPGPPADPATVAAIEALEWQLTACSNANDWRRILAFYTDEVLREALASYAPDAGEEIAADFLASPVPWDWREWESVLVRDVRRLPNGQVGAIVDTCGRVEFHIYDDVDGRWLIANSIWLEDLPRSFCRYPAFNPGTPVP